LPKKFSDFEKQYIIKRLKEEALNCISIYGIKKTTVDELVRRVNIPKGTFYLFYASKELLIFDALNDIHNEIQNQIIEDVEKLKQDINVENFTDFLFYTFQKVNDTGLLQIIQDVDFELFMRRLPEEIVKEHLAHDDFNMELLFQILPLKGNKNIDSFSGAFRGIFLTMLHQREIGEKIYEDALRLMLRGLVIQMMEEDKE
jgi:AcrR family transcriptional regulator